jgi:peptidoglycan/LPS O-acetylase OafA/YrhL
MSWFTNRGVQDKTVEAGSPGAYVAALDGVRALAIVAVYLLHIYRPRFPGGGIGVDIFFVLSGYLITGILLRSSGSKRNQLGAFYIRRATRLLPALVVWVALFATPSAVMYGQAHLIAPDITGALFYFNDILEALHHVAGSFDQSWSLAVEEQFYLVWPAILLYLIVRRSQEVQIAIFGLITAAAVVLLFSVGNYFLPTGHLVALAVGSWASWYRNRRGDRPSSTRKGATIGCGAAALLMVSILWAGPRAPWQFDMWSVLLDIAAIVLILKVDCTGQSPVIRLFGCGPARWIGSRSYGIYLYGLTLIGLVAKITHLRLHFAVLVDVAVTCAVVELSFRYIEAPIRLAGRRWSGSRLRK